MKQRTYVAPCASHIPAPMNQRSCDGVVGVSFITPRHDGVAFWTVMIGLFLVVGGAGAAEQANMVPGVVGIAIGLIIAFTGAVRLHRR